MDFIIQLQHSAVMDWVRESGSLLGYPAILFLHTIGLATVAGLNGAIDLRLLGVASQIPLPPLNRFFPFIWAGFGVSALSGVTLLIADAETKLRSPVFYIKMAFIILALINLQLLKKRVFADPSVDAHPVSSQAQMLALSSLLFWVAATTAGRLMAYIGPVAGLGELGRTMNAPHLHLILNHVPTIGSAIALGLLLLGLLRRQEALTRVSLEVFYVIALITLPAYLSGVATGMELEKMPDISVEAIHKHHDGALVAFALMILTGLASWLGLWRWRRV